MRLPRMGSPGLTNFPGGIHACPLQGSPPGRDLKSSALVPLLPLLLLLTPHSSLASLTWCQCLPYPSKVSFLVLEALGPLV